MTFIPYTPPTTEEGKRNEQIAFIRHQITAGRPLTGYVCLLQALEHWPGHSDLISLAREWRRKVFSRGMDLGSNKATEMSDEISEVYALDRLLGRLDIPPVPLNR